MPSSDAPGQGLGSLGREFKETDGVPQGGAIRLAALDQAFDMKKARRPFDSLRSLRAFDLSDGPP